MTDERWKQIRDELVNAESGRGRVDAVNAACRRIAELETERNLAESAAATEAAFADECKALADSRKKRITELEDELHSQRQAAQHAIDFAEGVAKPKIAELEAKVKDCDECSGMPESDVTELVATCKRLRAERDKARESLLALRKKVYGEKTATDIVRDEP